MAVPKTFTGGERLFAEDLNDNFADLDSKVAAAAASATNASDLAFGTVAAERLPNVPLEKLPNIPAANITNDGFPFKIAYGTATGSNTSNVTLTFPAGRFTTAPSWVATSSDAGSSRAVTYSAITASAVTFATWRTENSTRNLTAIQWIAVGS